MGLDWEDLDPRTWPVQVKKGWGKLFGPGQAEKEGAALDWRNKQALATQGTQAGAFANVGQQGYGDMTREGVAAREMMRRRAMGQDSLSAEQLRQALGQQLAQQRSMAASASPQNQAMAARTAQMQMGRQSAGMSGQAATAGIQERAAAEKALSDSIMQQRQQDAQVALGSRQNAITGFGGGKEQDEKKNWIEKYGPLIAGAAAAFSDRRLKTDIEDGDKKADRVLKGLKAYSYKYKDAEHGDGEQMGIMAQDLERAGLKHAVIDTPAGKMVHGAKAATAGLALVTALGRRVEKLEGKKK